MDRKVPSASRAGETLFHSRWPPRIAPFSGKRAMAFWKTGNQATLRKEITLAATSRAARNCTRKNRPNEARAKAATPPKVIGCQGRTGVSIVERGQHKPGGRDNGKENLPTADATTSSPGASGRPSHGS